MLIACEKCSTTYVLDDALIPPQGAPVQCTRCGHVFTARVPGSDLSTTQPGPPSWDAGKARPNNATMAFGQPAASAAQPTHQTMMFGGPGQAAGPAAGSPAPQAASQAASQGGKQTMVFGAPGGGAAPAPGTPVSRQTMVFGAATAAPPASPAAPQPGKQTMVLGAPGGGATPAPTPAGRQTMVFGAAASSPPAAPASQPGKQTMVFGAPAVGSPAAQPGKQTMVFGAPAVGAPGAPQAQPASPAGKQTMVFGAPAVGSPAAQPGKQTMVFGAPAVAPAPEAPPARNQTMMFGRAPGAGQAPRVTASTVELGTAGEEVRERSESTVRVDLEAMMRAEGNQDFEATQQRHDRTQRFAMTEGAAPGGPVSPPTTPSAGAESVEARHNRTQLFAMSSQQETTKPDSLVPPKNPQAGWAQRPVDSTLPPSFADMPTLEPDAASPPTSPAVHQTLVFGGQGARAQVTTDPGLDPPGVRVLLEPGMMTPPEAQASAPEPIATTLPNLAPIERGQELPPLRVDLPPEPTFPAGQAMTERALPEPGASDDAAVAELRRSSNRRTAIAVVVFLVVALGLGLALLWHLFGRSLLGGGAAEAEVHAQVDEAVALLRMDDAASRTKAVKRLERVLAEHPDSVDARAGLVLAHSFSYDDEGVMAKTLEGLVKRARATPEDVQAAKDRRSAAEATLKAELEKLRAARQALPKDAPGSLVALRGLAVAHAVLGDALAIELGEQHRQASPRPDDWAELAMPEYVATGGTSIDEALKQLEAIRGRESNSTFFRVLVLSARLHQRNGDPVAAREALETVVTLNSKHELAARLKEALQPDGDGAASAARKP